MQKYIDAAFSSRPVMPLSGAKVTVTTANGDLATLYSDNAGTLMGNPIYTDSAGNYSFYAADGRYTITISKTGFQTQVITDVLLEDPSDQVADLNALQLTDYEALRQYAGPRKSVYVTGYLSTTAPSGVAGTFVRRDDLDPATATDNGGTRIVGVKVWDRVYSGALLAAWFGVSATSLDNAPAINATIAAAKAIGGAVIAFPHGAIRYSSEILIDSPSIRLVGTGRRKVYPGVMTYSANVPTTLLPLFSGPAAIRVFNSSLNVASTFQMSDINLATLETGSMPTAAIGFDGSGNFQRDFTFERVGIHGFTSAFDTYNTGGDTAFGTIKIVNCAINRNQYIARNLTGQWNGFTFWENEAGQNIAGGIDIKAQSASIRSNSLEGQPNTVRISGNYRSLEIGGNYFEQNSGAYVIQLNQTIGAIIHPNFWNSVTATEKISLVNDVNTANYDRCVASCLGSVGYRTHLSVIDPVPLGSASVMLNYEPHMLKGITSNGSTGFDGYQISAPALPHPAIEDSAAHTYTTSGTGLITYTKSGLSIASGDYISVGILVSYVDVPVLPPRMELRVNSTNTDGYANPTFYNFDKAMADYKNKTVLYFGVVKATNAVTSFQFFFYPFGLNPAAGLVCAVGMPFMADIGASLPSISNVGSAIQAGIPETHVKMVSAIPTVGTWPAGYRLKYRAPAAGGYEGAICTTTGTPGTWKNYGAISA